MQISLFADLTPECVSCDVALIQQEKGSGIQNRLCKTVRTSKTWTRR